MAPLSSLLELSGDELELVGVGVPVRREGGSVAVGAFVDVGAAVWGIFVGVPVELILGAVVGESVSTAFVGATEGGDDVKAPGSRRGQFTRSMPASLIS